MWVAHGCNCSRVWFTGGGCGLLREFAPCSRKRDIDIVEQRGVLLGHVTCTCTGLLREFAL